MPEVVEVCLTSEWLNNILKNSVLSKVTILKGRYLKNEIPGINNFKKNTYKIINVESKGKFMWFELRNLKDSQDKLYILNRFGLSGEWTQNSDSNIQFTIKKGNNSFDIYFSDPRNFGTLEFAKVKKLNSELNKLADDFLKVPFTNQDFHDRIKNYLGTSKTRKNKEIVKVLMDQTKKNGLGSGLGNYLVSSVLYSAKVSPYTTMDKIFKNKSISDKLAESIRYIVKLSYYTSDIGYFEHLDKNIVSFLKKVRKDNKDKYHSSTKIGKDKFKFDVYRQEFDPLGNPVLADKIIPGRTTYWVPAVQKS